MGEGQQDLQSTERQETTSPCARSYYPVHGLFLARYKTPSISHSSLFMPQRVDMPYSWTLMENRGYHEKTSFRFYSTCMKRTLSIKNPGKRCISVTEGNVSLCRGQIEAGFCTKNTPRACFFQRCLYFVENPVKISHS